MLARIIGYRQGIRGFQNPNARMQRVLVKRKIVRIAGNVPSSPSPGASPYDSGDRLRLTPRGLASGALMGGGVGSTIRGEGTSLDRGIMRNVLKRFAEGEERFTEIAL